MKKEEFCIILSECAYAEEALTFSKKIRLRKYLASAACLCLVISASVFAFSRDATTKTEEESMKSEYHSETESTADREIFLNEIKGNLDASRIWYDPELYDTVEWGEEEIEEYYGEDFLKSIYIPDGLKAAKGNGGAVVTISKDGKMAMDTVWFNFYHDYYEDGSPKMTEDIHAVKGFSVKASKVGITDCYLYLYDDVKSSDIEGVEVVFGYVNTPYGPYDRVTHEPSGYYDVYTAEFTMDGTEYKVTFDQMELDEAVKVVSSIIDERQK